MEVIKIVLGNEHECKDFFINFILALVLTLKMTRNFISFNTLDYFIGISVFCLFAANFNTLPSTWEYAKSCKGSIIKVRDLIEIYECQ